MIWIVLIFLGLVFGSFINALVWRLHEQEELLEKGAGSKSAKERLRKLSITKGRSMCSHCGHELAPKDLVPVLSWLWLRGKCRYCHKPIADNPLPEVILPVLFVLSYAAWPALSGGLVIAGFVTWLAVLVVLLALALYDARWFELPNKLVLVVTIGALALVVLHAIDSGEALIVLRDALLGVLAIAGVFYVLYQLSKGEWIGGGDVKLGVALGLLAGGLLEAMLLLFTASVLGSLLSLVIFAVKRQVVRNMRVPFGPFLIIGAIVVVLSGADILDAYNRLLFGVW